MHNSDKLPTADDAFNSSGSLSGFSSIDCGTSSSPQCFVVAGSNANNPILSDSQGVAPSEMGVDDVSSGALENIASGTAEKGYENFYKNYPASVGNIRNPFRVWDQEYGQ